MQWILIIFAKKMHFYLVVSYFCCNFAAKIRNGGLREGVIKRESGVNPGQTRCCES